MSFNIHRNTLSNLAVTVVILAAAACAGGQNLSDFSSLEKHVDKEVSVETSEGQRVTGKLMRAEQSRIVVYQAGTPIPILRESVKTVTRHKNRHTAAWVDSSTGVLTHVADVKASDQPFSLSTDAAGKFVYVANAISNDVSVFAINANTGGLTAISGSPFPAGTTPRALVSVSPH